MVAWVACRRAKQPNESFSYKGPRPLVLFALIVGLLACQGPGSPQPAGGGPPGGDELAASQEFRFNLGGEPPGLDPQYVGWDSSVSVLWQLFEGLLSFDENLKLVTAGAREVPSVANGGISSDGKTYTFRLRDDVKWSDGQPVTARDFVYGIRRLFDPDRGAQYASFYFDIVGGKAYFTAKGTREQPRTVSESELRALRDRVGARALDDYTLRVELVEPRPTFLQLAALWPMYPIRQDVVEKHGDSWTEAGNLISNGPFKMAEWVHRDHITLVPNEHYYREKPSLTKITLRMITDANADFASYLNGEVEGVRVPLLNVQQVLSDERLRSELRRVPKLTTRGYQFNVKRPPFDKKAVRQAFSQAIDREVFIRQVQRGVGKPAYSWVPPGMPGHQEHLGKEVNKFDPATARRLLAEAGYPEGRGLPPITFQYANTGGNPLAAQFLQGQLKEHLGVEITLDPMEPASFSRLVNAYQHHFALMGWIADYPDPDNWLPELFGTGSGNNHSQYSNPQLDDLMRRATLELDEARRLQMWNQAQEMLVNDVPMIFLVHEESLLLYKPYVRGLTLTPMDGSALPGRDFMRQVWLAKR